MLSEDESFDPVVHTAVAAMASTPQYLHNNNINYHNCCAYLAYKTTACIAMNGLCETRFELKGAVAGMGGGNEVDEEKKGKRKSENTPSISTKRFNDNVPAGGG